MLERSETPLEREREGDEDDEWEGCTGRIDSTVLDR